MAGCPSPTNRSPRLTCDCSLGKSTSQTVTIHKCKLLPNVQGQIRCNCKSMWLSFLHSVLTKITSEAQSCYRPKEDVKNDVQSARSPRFIQMLSFKWLHCRVPPSRKPFRLKTKTKTHNKKTKSWNNQDFLKEKFYFFFFLIEAVVRLHPNCLPTT